MIASRISATCAMLANPLPRLMLPFRTLAFALSIALSLASVSQAQTPVLHYTFDDAGTAPGGTTADSGSGTPAPGTAQGGATYVTDTPASFSLHAASVTGLIGSRINGGDADKVDGLSAFTITMWVKLRENPLANDRLISERAGSAPPDSEGFFDLSLAANNNNAISASSLRLRMTIDIGAGGGIEFNTSNGVNLGLDRWVFLAVTYDGAAAAGDAGNFFLGTETVSTGQLPQVGTSGGTDPAGQGTILGNGRSLMIGDLPDFNQDRTPNALFDDVRIYDSVLSLSQIESARLANIPEPHTAALLLLGLAGFSARRRRSA